MMQIGKEKRRRHEIEIPSYKYYPAIKLHYLGVDSRHRKKGYGVFLLFVVLELVTKLSEDSGCLFLSVESLPSSVSFYHKYEFKHLSFNKPFTNMFFKIGEL
ncbi:hypothetical protein [Paenibacillus kribbensis]|uniref:hypothetical protein n=1 Tax=Paenibacillus kribbensis TaxID=172713 RepID=UPI0015BF514A|nr:hypothetical protein [Paenibacillus kribbensis]